jgi:hypothetical protein
MESLGDGMDGISMTDVCFCGTQMQCSAVCTENFEILSTFTHYSPLPCALRFG